MKSKGQRAKKEKKKERESVCPLNNRKRKKNINTETLFSSFLSVLSMTCPVRGCPEKIMIGVNACVCCQKTHCLYHLGPETHGCGVAIAQKEKSDAAAKRAAAAKAQREPQVKALHAALEEKKKARQKK